MFRQMWSTGYGNYTVAVGATTAFARGFMHRLNKTTVEGETSRQTRTSGSRRSHRTIRNALVFGEGGGRSAEGRQPNFFPATRHAANLMKLARSGAAAGCSATGLE